jgi:hypothetical protein
MMHRIALIAAVVAVAGAMALPADAADVHVGINVGVPPPPPIVFEFPPRLIAVPEAPQVLYAPDVSVSFFSYGNRYYSYNDGHWFIASAERGPWTYIERRRVPHQVLVVPARYYHGGHEHHGHGHHDDHHDDGHHGHHED